MRRLLLPLLLWIAAPVAAGPLQDAYNAAQAALDAGRNAEAAQGFATLLAKLPNADRPGNRTAAVVRARLGAAYLRLDQAYAARGILERAMKDMPTANSDDRRENLLTRLDLAHAFELLQEYNLALAAYRDALLAASVSNSEQQMVEAQVAIARLTLFADPAAARRALDAAIPLAERLLTEKNMDQLGDVYALRARIEFNHGDYRTAQLWLDKALKVAGGLDLKVSIFDTRIRSDLGIWPIFKTIWTMHIGISLLPVQGICLPAAC